MYGAEETHILSEHFGSKVDQSLTEKFDKIGSNSDGNQHCAHEVILMTPPAALDGKTVLNNYPPFSLSYSLI